MSANGSVVVVNAKDAIMREKKKSFSLSKTKVDYIESVKRDDDSSGEFVLVVRDVDTTFAFSSFGVGKLDEIEKTFYAILATLNTHRQHLLGTSMFSTVELETLLNGLSEKDLKNMPDNVAIHAKDIAKIVLGPAQVRMVLDKFPRVGLLTTKAVDGGSENDIKTGIYLFVGEVIKLVKFLNTEFGFSASECLIMPAKNQLQRFELDDFFLPE